MIEEVTEKVEEDSVIVGGTSKQEQAEKEEDWEKRQSKEGTEAKS